jgi:hypothetical protein
MSTPKELSWFQKEALKILGIAHEEWDMLAPLFANGFIAAIRAVIPILSPIVLGLAADPSKSGVAKTEAAISTAVPQLEAAGINAGTNVLNSAITVLVSQLPQAATVATSTDSVVAETDSKS